MVTSPLSRGWRSASITSTRRSGNSSSSSTPQWARLISPGRTWPLPPPMMLALLASWWGAEKGGRVSIPLAGSRVPAREWIAVSSRASSGVRSGRMPGIRSAMLVLPAPLGPSRRRWWPPAAATSTAYRASGMPRRSDRSTSSIRSSPRHASSWLLDRAATGGASGTSSPQSSATTCLRLRMPSTTMPGTIAASPACGSGTNTRVIPREAAASTIGSTPADRAQATVEGQLADERRAGQRALRDLAVGSEHGHGDGEVEVGAPLEEVGRREQDRDPLRRGPQPGRC